MMELLLAAFLTGFCASFVMPVLPFAVIVCAATVLRVAILISGDHLTGHALLTSIVCLAVAQASYVIGLVVRSFMKKAHAGENGLTLAATRRKMKFQRK